MSGFLMFVLAVATDTRAVGEAAAIAIGGTIGPDAMFGIVAPVSGTSLGGLAYQFVRGEQTRPAEVPAPATSEESA